MRYDVLVTTGAEADVLGIWLYVAENDSMEAADYVIGQIKDLVESLHQLPTRGHVPPELERVGVRDYLQLHFKPYRIIYHVSRDTVEVYCVIDRRRDMQTLLLDRLLR